MNINTFHTIGQRTICIVNLKHFTFWLSLSFSLNMFFFCCICCCCWNGWNMLQYKIVWIINIWKKNKFKLRYISFSETKLFHFATEKKCNILTFSIVHLQNGVNGRDDEPYTPRKEVNTALATHKPVAIVDPKVPTKNIAGPPVYYPPDQELFAKSEQSSAAWRAQVFSFLTLNLCTFVNITI